MAVHSSWLVHYSDVAGLQRRLVTVLGHHQDQVDL